MSSFQLAIAAGAGIGLGLALVLAYLAPAQPDLKSSMARLDPAPTTRQAARVPRPGWEGTVDRVGVFVEHQSSFSWTQVPPEDLAILRLPLYRHLGEKVITALIGLIAIPLLTALLALAGITFPLVLPGAVSLVAAAAGFVFPDFVVRSKATAARRSMVAACATYADLIALEREAGLGTGQALREAAEVGSSWMFTRLRERLALAEWSRQPSWEALHDLSNDVAVHELGDIADIMRTSGQETASVSTHLRARASAIRSAQLNDELAKANAAGEQLNAPASLLLMAFLVLVTFPFVSRLMG